MWNKADPMGANPEVNVSESILCSVFGGFSNFVWVFLLFDEKVAGQYIRGQNEIIESEDAHISEHRFVCWGFCSWIS